MILQQLFAASPGHPVRVGRYDVTGLIGAGGMGAVFEAFDRDNGSSVALKTLIHLDARSLLRFKTEFRAVADLSHRNLVSLYELGRHEDLWFFTMERLQGVDLITWLRGASAPSSATSETRTRTDYSQDQTTSRVSVISTPGEPSLSMPASIPRLRDAVAQLVSGVQALHRAGLLHLDLKPSNVLVSPEGRVVVVDFGLVRSVPAPAVHGAASLELSSFSGTPLWMAPEQYLGDRISEATDWYAVGLMLYRALTGVMAFSAVDIGVLYRAKIGAPPSAPRLLLPGLPEDLSSLAMALLAPEPELRPTGADLAALLASAPSAPPAAARRPRAALVGRGAERGRLREALRQVREGRAAVVHLRGLSGAGKTALLGHLLDEARREQGAIVLRGRCYEREAVPYKAFDSMIDELAAQLSSAALASLPLPAWMGELARVFPVLARVPAVASCLDATPSSLPSVELRRRALEALRELLCSIAARGPLVLGFDDLQWADADSALLLAKLLEAPAPGGLLIAAALRPQEALASLALAPYLDELRLLDERSDVLLASIEVGPLPVDEARQLAQAALAAFDLPESIAVAIAGESAGVPFFIEELARHAALQRDAGADVSTAGLSLDRVLSARVQSLSRGERSLVEALAVANNPIPRAVALAAARFEAGGAMRALWSLRAGHFVRGSSSSEDRVELQHDRMRESVLASMAPERIAELHLSLGLVMLDQCGGPAQCEASPWLFDVVRHLDSARELLGPEERAMVARLALAAGRRARAAAAFPLAFACFRAGTGLIDAQAWDDDYELALDLHNGAAESASLSAAWRELDEHVAIVKARGRTVLDQLVSWEAQIDAFIARKEYDPALDTALQALRLLGVDLPAHPGNAEVGAGLQRAIEALARVGLDGMASLPPASDPVVAASMRIQTRIGSASYFARPPLFPVLACNQVVASVNHGLSPATPYALSVYGIVLNTLGMHREAHAWGRVALGLLARVDDRSLDARTRHVIYDLVCTWIVPLETTLDPLREVVSIGKKTGDLEYASYAAHAYVHNAFYAARPLDALLDEAVAFRAFMSEHRQGNALHVHVPFVQAIRCLTGRTLDPARLDGDGFSEEEALARAEHLGSQSAQCIVRLLMGLVRYLLGSAAEASACLEGARPFLGGVASAWHIPALHQYASLAAAALPAEARAALRPRVDESLAALRALAEQGPDNFAHRVPLVEAEWLRAEGQHEAALALFARAIEGAARGRWLADLGLAHALAARCHEALGDAARAADHRAEARQAHERWGAHALADRLR